MDQADHFANALVHVNVVYGHDVVTALSRDYSVRKGIFSHFSSCFRANWAEIK